MKELFSIAKCKSKAAYSAKLRKQGVLNLVKVRGKFDVVLDTPVLLVVKVDGVEVVVHGYGELLFKNCSDTSLMEKIAEKIYLIGLCTGQPDKST